MNNLEDSITIEEIEKTIKKPIPAIVTPFNDPGATWVYWNSHDTMERGIIIEWVWERLRYRRDSLLHDSDFRMIPDAPWEKQTWVIYRQELRDLPKKTKDPRLAQWPVQPNE